MKTCAKCGKNVADSTPMCPKCGSFMFHTEKNGLEGIFSQFLMDLNMKNPKAFWILMAVIVGAFVIFLIWAFNS